MIELDVGDDDPAPWDASGPSRGRSSGGLGGARATPSATRLARSARCARLSVANS